MAYGGLRERAEYDTMRRRELRDTWNAVCAEAGYPLARWIPMPDGYTVVYPKIEKIVLGEPTTLLVWLRPGQIPSDVEAYAARLAYALGVAALRVRETDTRFLLRIELLEQPLERVEQEIPRLPQQQTGPFAHGPSDDEAA